MSTKSLKTRLAKIEQPTEKEERIFIIRNIVGYDTKSFYSDSCQDVVVWRNEGESEEDFKDRAIEIIGGKTTGNIRLMPYRPTSGNDCGSICG